jgi:two-component system sensor histidine kinase/response regulator
LPPTAGDAILIRQVWCNLLGNALKYSAHKTSPNVRVGGRVEGRESVYQVDDNGAGFDMKYAHKLFGVFQRLHKAEDFSGTGVGLAIVQRIVLRHGGRIWAQGAPGAGASFQFSLPAIITDQ